jgi:hypothetical protein
MKIHIRLHLPPACVCVLRLLLCPRPGTSRYVLPTPTGDTGIVRTLDVPVYLTECNDTTLHCLDRDGKTMSIMIDNSGTYSILTLPQVFGPFLFVAPVCSVTLSVPLRLVCVLSTLVQLTMCAWVTWPRCTEYLFKLALANKQYVKVMQYIRSSRLCGQVGREALLGFCAASGYVVGGGVFVHCWISAITVLNGVAGLSRLSPPCNLFNVCQCVCACVIFTGCDRLPAAGGVPRGCAALCQRRAHAVQPVPGVRQPGRGAAGLGEPPCGAVVGDGS